MKTWMKIVGVLVLVAVLPLFTGTKGATQAAEPEYTFYMITHSQSADVFWASVNKGMEDAAASLNVKAVYLGSTTSGNVSQMVSNLETTLAAKPDGIAISITEPNALDPLLRNALKQGIPVVAINVKDFRAEKDAIPYLRYIGEDSYMTGATQAKAVLNAFQAIYGRVPKAAVFGTHEPGNIVQEIRAKGVIETVTAAGVKTAEIANITYDPSKASELMRAYLEAHPDVEYIATGNSAVAHWMAQLLKDLGRLGKTNEPMKEGNVFVGAIDLDEQVLNDIIAGDVVATIDQQPYLQGYFGIQLLYLWNKHSYMPGSDIATGPFLVDKSNADQMLKLLLEKGRL
jgi:simple sugar transport system substrate-binding protein